MNASPDWGERKNEHLDKLTGEVGGGPVVSMWFTTLKVTIVHHNQKLAT